jgi:hypothetical protein
MIQSIRDADPDVLPDIIREVRADNQDCIVATMSATPPGDREPKEAVSPKESSYGPMAELGKVMGSLQIDYGEVHSKNFDTG